MTVLIILGVGIIMFGVGLFIGKIISKSIKHNLNGLNQKPPSIYDKWVQGIKDNMAQKTKEKQIRKQLQTQAREQALKNMQPALVKHMQEQELKKLTGEDKKEKLAKFGNMFAMGGDQGSFNTTNKLNNMLGIQQPIQQIQRPHQPVQQIQRPQQPIQQIQRPHQPVQQIQRPHQPVQPQYQQPVQPQYQQPVQQQPQFDINKILGTSQKGPTFNSVNEQVLGGPQGPTFNSVNEQILGKKSKTTSKKQTASQKMAELLS